MPVAADEFLLPDYRVSRYRFTLRAINRIVLPRDRVGIILRGAFGLAFRKLVCHDLQAECRGCPLSGACPYARVFTPSPPADAERLRLQSDIPRPFVVAPDLEKGEEVRPATLTQFELTLIGESVAWMPYFVVAFRALGEQGIGPGRGRFVLESVVAEGRRGEPVYRFDQSVVRNIECEERPGAFPAGSVAGRWTVHYRTPTLLRSEGEAAEVPEFHHLVKRLRDRVNATQYFYCGKAWEVDHRALGLAAESVAIVQDAGRWVEQQRRSSRTGAVHAIPGYLGDVTYAGDMAPFLPLLRVGERINVGKAATFGCGRIEIEPEG
ncbi:MAG: CRISPR system precrRNA processing endoribonuclease RAMP protein Cas6 [Deltaproteobacteria bacterium]|nr:CRISPR system precrRNA processing endoribonuclease RAMP protein Cas6 [Deltaproteobacteria bacterium]